MKERKSGTSVFHGAILMLAMRWTDRLIGFVSTLILARLLVPEDFGIIAMAALAIGLVDVFLDFGVNIALIQNPDATSAHYNSAWTLRLIQMSIATLVVILAAPLASEYFNDPRVEPVLQVMALGLLLVGLENIGVIAFQKEMRFDMDFLFMFSKRFIGFVATMVVVWIWRNYWALVIGALTGRGFGVLISYVIHPMRPRISFEKFKEIFRVSQWNLARSIGLYLDQNLHKMLIGRKTNTATLGGYTMADDISSMPVGEVLAPLNRVLFPAFVQAKHNLIELKRLFLLAQGVQTLIAVPASVGLALVAEDAVFVLLGEQWLFAAQFIEVLVLANVVQAITTSAGYIMITMGKVQTVALLAWIQVLIFVVLTSFLLPTADALQIAWLRVLTVFIGLVVMAYLIILTLSNLTLMDMGKTIFRPLLSTLVLIFAVGAIGQLGELHPLLGLIVKVGVGMVAYIVAIISFWLIAGKPVGAEFYLWGKIKELLHPA